MQKEEALRILGVFDEEDPEQIRKRYRQLIRRYHPDEASDPGQDPEQIRRITQAYRVLKTEGLLHQEDQRRSWGIRENPKAFMKRTIFMREDLFGSGLVADTGIRGKFYWDPELEPFEMLLKSASAAAARILSVSDMYSEMDEERGMRMQAKLLHLLLQQFIDPYEAVQALPSIRRGQAENRYRISCHLKWTEKKRRSAESGAAGTAAGNRKNMQQGFSVGRQGNRLYAMEEGEQIGTLSFPENALYYIVTPMILQNAATARFFPADNEMADHTSNRNRSGNSHAGTYTTGQLILMTDPDKRKDPTEKINAEIARMLRQGQVKYSTR